MEPMEPSTPLPWERVDGTNRESPIRSAFRSKNGVGFVADYERFDDDLDYALFACNSYPALVERVKELERLLYLAHDLLADSVPDIDDDVEIGEWSQQHEDFLEGFDVVTNARRAKLLEGT